MPNKKQSFFNTPDTVGSRKATKQIITGKAETSKPLHDNYHTNNNGNINKRGRRPTNREKMTRRVVVLLTPSKYERLLSIAYDRDISFNELVNGALDVLPELSEEK